MYRRAFCGERLRMIASMTGYGRAVGESRGKSITVEIKSVNHRYFELNSRVPRIYMQLDDIMRRYLQQRIVRGKIDVNISVALLPDAPKGQVLVNKTLLGQYIDAIYEGADAYGLKHDLTASTILRLPDVITSADSEEDSSDIWEDVRPVLDKAVDMFIARRQAEGENLAADIIGKCRFIEENVAKIEAYAPELLRDYRNRLETKIKELLEDRQIDEQRLLTEVAIMADKLAVDEETVRLRSHCQAMKQMLSSGISNGKKMDFIVQEMNREVNTISSKIGNIDVTKIAIELKNCIEKIREQIQNIE